MKSVALGCWLLIQLQVEIYIEGKDAKTSATSSIDQVWELHKFTIPT